MGLIDELDQLDLADDVKEKIRREHEDELNGKTVELSQLRAQARKSDVEKEVDGLKALFGEDQAGLLKFVRRVLLSDDSEPGLVLLSDTDMQLSGDDATGATQKEEITVAGAIREFISLLPKKEDGTLALSDQVLAGNSDDKPAADDEDDPANKSKAASQRLGAIAGHTTVRTRKRYAGRHAAGGDA